MMVLNEKCYRGILNLETGGKLRGTEDDLV